MFTGFYWRILRAFSFSKHFYNNGLEFDQNTLQLIPVCMSEPLGKLVTHTLVHVCYMYYTYYMYVCVRARIPP